MKGMQAPPTAMASIMSSQPTHASGACRTTVTSDALAEICGQISQHNTEIVEQLVILNSIADDLHGPVPPTTDTPPEEDAHEGRMGDLLKALVTQVHLMGQLKSAVARL